MIGNWIDDTRTWGPGGVRMEEAAADAPPGAAAHPAAAAAAAAAGARPTASAGGAAAASLESGVVNCRPKLSSSLLARRAAALKPNTVSGLQGCSGRPVPRPPV